MHLTKREFAAFLFKDWRRTVSVFGAVMLISCIAAIAVAPKYSAGSTLLVLLAPEYGYRPEAGSGALVNVTIDRDSILNSEISILTSASVEKAAIEKVGLGRLYPGLARKPGLIGRLILACRSVAVSLHLASPAVDPIDLAVNKMARSIKALPDKTANIIGISFSHTNAAVAADTANALVAAYLEKRHEIYADVESNLLQQQADSLSQQLGAISQTYAENAAQNSISDYSAQLEEYVRQRANLESSMRESDANIADQQKRFQLLASQLGTTPESIVDYSENDADRRVEALRVRLADAQAEVATLQQRYRDESPILQRARQQALNLQKAIDAANTNPSPSSVRTSHSQVFETLTLDRIHAKEALDASKARRQQVATQIDAVNATIANFTSKKTKLDELSRQKGLVEQSYMSVMKALAERRMVEGIDQQKTANVRIVQYAEPPLSPAPIRIVILVAGLFLSLILAVLTVLVAFALRRSYFTPEDLERSLGVPTLSSLPLLGADPPYPAAPAIGYGGQP